MQASDRLLSRFPWRAENVETLILDRTHSATHLSVRVRTRLQRDVVFEPGCAVCAVGRHVAPVPTTTLRQDLQLYVKLGDDVVE